MLMPIFLIIYLLVIAFFIILATLLLIRQDRKDETSHHEHEDQLIHNAIQKSQEILSAAELDSIKIMADSKFYKNKMEDQIEGHFENFTNQAETVISQDVTKAEQDFLEYMNALKTNLEKSGQDYVNYLNYLKNEADLAKNQNQETIKQQINTIFVKLEENLGQFLTETQQKSTQSIELELQAARNLIQSYKEQQLKIVDENILAMLETTLSLVLAKKLSLQDQLDLIYESLEKAKAEKFVV